MNLKPTEAVTGKVRLNFPALFTPVAMDKNKPEDKKYGCQILVPKSDKATMDRLKAAIDEAVKLGISGAWGGVTPAIIHKPVHDGDGTKPVSGESYGDECKEHYVLNATANINYPPDVVDTQLNPILNQSEIYSGVYARVLLNFYPYNYQGKKGIGVSIGNVQKIADGTPLGGAPKKSADVFGEVKYDDLTGEEIV